MSLVQWSPRTDISSFLFPGSSDVKESACNVGDLGSIPGLGRSPGEQKCYPLQYSGLENSMDCIVHGLAKIGHNWATFTSLHTHIHTHTHTYINRILGRNSLSVTLKILFIYLTVPCLNRGLWDLVPSPGIEPRPPVLTAQSLSQQESPTFNHLLMLPSDGALFLPLVTRRSLSEDRDLALDFICSSCPNPFSSQRLMRFDSALCQASFL